MLEFVYALFKEQTIEQIIYTMLAETIYYKYGSFENGQLKIVGDDYPKRINRILEKIELDKETKITWKEILILKEYFLEYLTKNNYIKKLPIIGHVKSKKLRLEVKNSLQILEPNIKEYIETGKKEKLIMIFKDIDRVKLKFPEYDGFGSFYKDSQDIVQGYFDIRAGKQRDYSEYYTVSKKKKVIR